MPRAGVETDGGRQHLKSRQSGLCCGTNPASVSIPFGSDRPSRGEQDVIDEERDTTTHTSQKAAPSIRFFLYS